MMEYAHWWETVELGQRTSRECVRWDTPGQTVTGRLMRARTVKTRRHGPRRVYDIDADSGRRLLVWGTVALRDWLDYIPLGCRVRIRYLGAMVGRDVRTHLRLSVRCIGRQPRRRGRA